MKKSAKRTLMTAIALTLCGSFVFTGCRKLSDLVPDEYGAWENNYIYRGNVRSKTTGEEGENLVTVVEGETEAYDVSVCLDYDFVGDDIYMCLRLSPTDVTYKNAIVQYDVKEKRQKTVMLELTVDAESELGGTWAYEPYHIERIFEDEMLLYGNRTHTYVDEEGLESQSYQDLYFKIDLDGVLTEEESFDYSSFTRVSEDYYIRSVNTESGLAYEYITWNMTEPELICEINPTTANYTEVDFVEKNGAKGFLIADYIRSSSNGRKLDKLSFFDLKNGKTATVYDDKTLVDYVTWIEVPDKEYFMTYEIETVVYTVRKQFVKIEQKTATAYKNCVLHKIEYSENGVTVKTAHTFDADKGYTVNRGIAGNVMYVKGTWYESTSGCKRGGGQSEYYELDLTNGKFDKIKADEFDEGRHTSYGYYARQTGVICGDYSYYIQKDNIGIRDTAYILRRYDATSGTTDIMQLWASHADEAENYCQMMWRAGGEIDDFIVRNY